MADMKVPVKAVPKEKLKDYPYKGSGVNENAALRMIKMVVPSCPCESDSDADRIDSVFERRGLQRRTKPLPQYRGVENCQSGKYRYGWWEECEALGHNPYWTSTVTTRDEDVVGEDGIISAKRQRQIKKDNLNVIQVPVSLRHDSGRAVPDARGRGAKFLPEMGYKNVCEMRNCENPAKMRFRFGEFCGERHARLVLADQKKMMLMVWGDENSDWKELREEQLDGITLGTWEEVG